MSLAQRASAEKFKFPTLFRTASTSVEPRFNEPLYKEVLAITNDILQPDLLKCMEQNFDITNQFPLSLGTSLNRVFTVIERYFCVVCYYTGKADLTSGNHLFLAIFKLQFGNNPIYCLVF